MAGEHLERVEIRTLKALHDWLSKHHDSGKSVWLITGKKHTNHYLDYNDIIDELLCWGWGVNGGVKLGHGAAQNWATLGLCGTRVMGGGQSSALSI
jgi:hypothetical protein